MASNRRLTRICGGLACETSVQMSASKSGAPTQSVYPVNKPSPDRVVYISGEKVPETEAKLSVFDSAVTLGDQITDSSRTFGHKPFKLEQHIARLYRSAKAARIDIGITQGEMLRITLDLLADNLRLLGPHQDLWIVHNVSRGGGPDAPQTTDAGRR
eukprot:SAG11_NODE_2126_length_3781_cov_80.824823_2_plen_157_part_00